MKSQYRNPKQTTNHNIQISNKNISLGFEICYFEFVWGFDIGIWDLYLQPNGCSIPSWKKSPILSLD
jgi:hypothetical protein